MDQIILFDGECNFCDKSVQFIIKHDRIGYFKFASLQSPIGKQLRLKYDIPEIDSLIVIDEHRWYHSSTAVLKIAKKLNGLWKLGYIFILIPSPFRDKLYQFFAKHRYKWFGKNESCIIPTEDMKKRFL